MYDIYIKSLKPLLLFSMKNDDISHKDSNIVVIKALNSKMQKSSGVAELLKASTAHPGDQPRFSTWRIHSRRRELVIHIVF